jgi:PAS domain S-box-containing protein
MPSVDYEAIFEKAEVGIALNDPDTGAVGKVNERYAELMGYDRDELRTMKIEEISADDPMFDQDAAMEKIRQALVDERHQFDWLFERKDGTQFWAEVVLKRTKIGPQDRLLAFVRDISDRKQYEQELEQKNQKLNTFAGIVAHDLQNPLTVADGNLTLAREECDSEHLEDIERAHVQMRALIDDLLALARTGDTIQEIEAIDLGGVVETCWQNTETAAADLVIEDGATIKADRGRLQQFLQNLFRNSIEHAGDDVTVIVGVLPNGFYVEDDGTGIPEAERDKVFDAGYSTAQEGTGFGLSIVEEIAAAHDWDIHVTEGSDGGARFEITDVTFVK